MNIENDNSSDFILDVGKQNTLKKNYRYLQKMGIIFICVIVMILFLKLYIYNYFFSNNDDIEVSELKKDSVKDLDTKRIKFFDNNIKPRPTPIDTENDSEFSYPTENTKQIKNNENKSNIFSNNKQSNYKYLSKSKISMIISTSNPQGQKITDVNNNPLEKKETDNKNYAIKLNYDPTFLLRKGTYINCSLKTELSTMVSGNIECTITNDVYSANGNLLLVEKGSSIFGKYRSGQMKQGQRRLYVIWDEIITTKNIVIPISSEAVDNLGMGGVEGEIDNHWVERFGSAILLSFISETISAIASNLKRDVPTLYSTDTTKTTTENMVSKALDQTINIPPTLYKKHGDVVGIYVNKNIDFSHVYKLEKTQ